MDKKTSTLVGLIVVAGIALIIFVMMGESEPTAPMSPSPLPMNNNEAAVTQTIDTKKPGPNLTRYSYTGIVKAINAVGEQRQLVLQNGSNLTLPDFTLKTETRIWKKANDKFTKAAIADVKVGSRVDLHMDKEDKQGFWIFRDIYILE